MPRLKPMRDDKADDKEFRDREVGYPAHHEYQPMFFTKKRMALSLEGQYNGVGCFLVSNGPSVGKRELELLRKPGLPIMSVNNGATTLLKNGITPGFWVCVDDPCRFVKQIWLNPMITKFVPFSMFSKPLWDNEAWRPLNKTVGDCPNVVGFMRNEKFAAHRFLLESSVNWGCHKDHGGCRTVLLPAMRIPYLLGFRRLYLVGVDLNMDANNKYHFDEGRTKGAVRCNTTTYNRIITEYGPGIKKYGERLGYAVYNCNPASKLTCFEQLDLGKAVERETIPHGPTAEIQTRGMYVVWDKKSRMTREQAEKETGANA